MIILGIDPGLADTGWGLIEKQQRKLRYIAHGCFKTSAKEELPCRLEQIYNQLAAVIAEHKPSYAAIESLYFGKNTTSAMAVAHVRGSVLLLLQQNQIKSFSYTPNTIKQSIAGSGSADKVTVQNMTKIVLGLSSIPSPNHAADALAAAICCANGASSVSAMT